MENQIFPSNEKEQNTEKMIWKENLTGDYFPIKNY